MMQDWKGDNQLNQSPLYVRRMPRKLLASRRKCTHFFKAAAIASGLQGRLQPTALLAKP